MDKMITMNSKKVIVAIGFSIGIFLAYLVGIDLGQVPIKYKMSILQDQYDDLTNQYNDLKTHYSNLQNHYNNDLKNQSNDLKSDYNFTLKMSILKDNEMLNLQPHKFLNCLKKVGLDNATNEIKLNRTYFPTSKWFYVDEKMHCIISSQINHTSEIENLDGVK